MSLTNIMYDWGTNPTIIRITVTDDLTAITTTGYWTSVQDDVLALNNGTFQIPAGSIIAIVYDGGEGFFTFDVSDQTFVAETNPGSLSETLQENRIFVGSAENIATGVAMSGDATIVASGELTIANEAITNAKVADDAAIAFSKLADLDSANLLIGSSADVATKRAVTGDVTISNTGVTTIGEAKVVSSMVESTLLQHVQVDVSLAEFIGAFTASHLLVAAPGANKKLILHRATLWIDYGGTVLDNGGAIHIQYADTAEGAGTKATGTIAANTLISATADTSFGFTPVDTTLVDSATLNEGLYLGIATGDFTGGTDSAYKFDVWYSVLDVA